MFEITSVNVSGSLKAVVMATSYENPLSSVSEIETRLSALLGSNETGEILLTFYVLTVRVEPFCVVGNEIWPNHAGYGQNY